MAALALIGLATATALLAAASARLPSLVSTLLAAYLAFVAATVLGVLVLSPFREVTRAGLAAVETVMLAAAFGCWWLRGRPGLPLVRARRALRQIVDDPVSAAFLVAAGALLAYELLLVLTDPPNNTDSLVYHLPRVAAWAQHAGVYWIPNAPTDRMNEFQPVAEQEILFLFVATGKGALFALPQYLAQLATLVAVYGSARRLGFDVRAAACSAFLVATFALFALEATTAQNDLVATSFTAVAACLILAGGGLELALAGAAAALGLGVKLTTILVWPVLLVLLLRRGRRGLLPVAVGGVAGFVLVAMWGYVLNVVHTGHLLGRGVAYSEWQASPAFPGTLHTALHILYRTFDLSVLSYRDVRLLAAVGVVAGVAGGIYGHRRAGVRGALVGAGGGAIPFLAPLLTIGGANALAWATAGAGIPVHVGGWAGGLNRGAIEDSSAFGPLGVVLLLGVSVATMVAYAAGRADVRFLALALALPLFLVLFSLTSVWNPWETRFLLVPAALTAPLLAGWFGSRPAAVAALVAGTLYGALVLVHDVRKPIASPVGRPWNLSWVDALSSWQGAGSGPAIAAYDRLVPPGACTGAVLAPDEASFPLYGPTLAHRVVYLPVENAVLAALRNHLFYVVVGTGANRWAAGRFTRVGWTQRKLGNSYLLVVSPASGARTGACRAA